MEHRNYKFAKWLRIVLIVIVYGYFVALNRIPFEPIIKYGIYAVLVAVTCAYLRFFNIRFGAIHKEFKEKIRENQEIEFIKYKERQANVNSNIERYLAEQEAKQASKKWWQVWV